MKYTGFMMPLAFLAIALIACSETPEDPQLPDTPEIEEPDTPDEPDEPTPNPAVTRSGMILINGGSFTMGSPASEPWRENDEAEHSVTVGSFYIDKYEMTQKEYSEIMGVNPSSFTGNNRPVEMVSWYDAIAFCNALSEKENLIPAYTINGNDVVWNKEANGYRLPTEAEWEFACRAGTTSPFNTGRNITVDQSNWYSSYPYIEGEGGGAYRRQTVEVNEFQPNQLGLYNMHGNVSEWCWDRYGAYDNATQINPTGSENGINRVARGGGWYDYAKHVRSAYRSVAPPDYKDYKRGFRIARNVPNE